MKRRERILVILAAGVIALAVADRLVLGPLSGAWHGLSERLTARQAELTAARELIKREDSLRERYRVLVKQVAGGAGAHDVGARESAFLTFLQRCADRAGLEIAKEKPTRRAREHQVSRRNRKNGVKRYTETTVSLSFTCSMEALVRFLAEAGAGGSDGAAGEPVRVCSLRISSLDPAGRSLEVSLSLSTVALPLVEDLAHRRVEESLADGARGTPGAVLVSQAGEVSR